MRTVELDADSGLLAVFQGAAPATGVDDWLLEGLRAGRLLALRLGRAAVGRAKPWRIAIVTAADLEATLPRLEEGFAFALEVGADAMSIGDPAAPADQRRPIEPLAAGAYWAGLYPVSPDEELGDFALVFLPRAEALSDSLTWSGVPDLDHAQRTPEDMPSPIPVPRFDDDFDEADAAEFMRSLFSGRKPREAAPATAERRSPMHRGLQALVDAELLELVDPKTLGKLADRLEDDAAEDPFVMRHLGAWLVEQDEVDDVFGEDEELETIVRAHGK